MVSQGRVRDCVLIDLNTQYDFCDPKGRNPVRNCDTVVTSLRQVFAWAVQFGIPVVSSIDSHRPNEIDNHRIPEYCVDGSLGQRKLPFTELNVSITLDGDNTLWAPADLLATHHQVIFHKRTLDLLSNPKADRLLSQIRQYHFVLCGVSAEHSVRCLALGLLSRGLRVSIVRNACGFWTESDADLSMRLMQAKGARIICDTELPEPERKCYSVAIRYNGHRNGSNGGRSSNGTNGTNGTYGHHHAPPPPPPAM